MSGESIIPANINNMCHYCGRYVQVPHKHHVFGGANRKISDRYGLWVWLCPEHHNMGNHCVHKDKEMMAHYHEIGQKAFEDWYIEKFGADSEKARAEFMRLFGRNYL